MLHKKVTYTNYNGEVVNEDVYFNLTSMELVKMEAKYEISIPDKIKEVVETNDYKGIIALFEDLLLTAYGVKSEDGRRFIKDEQATKEFGDSIAYAEIFEQIILNPEAAKELGEEIAYVSQETKDQLKLD
mgnify:CR=1 FL=1